MLVVDVPAENDICEVAEIAVFILSVTNLSVPATCKAMIFDGLMIVDPVLVKFRLGLSATISVFRFRVPPTISVPVLLRTPVLSVVALNSTSPSNVVVVVASNVLLLNMVWFVSIKTHLARISFILVNESSPVIDNGLLSVKFMLNY
jgi:hypothetical protein